MLSPASQIVSVVQRCEDDVHVRLAGQLDIATLPQLRRMLGSVLAREPRRLLLDLAELEVIESAAAAYLVTVRETAEAAGVQVEVRGASDATQLLLERAADRFER